MSLRQSRFVEIIEYLGWKGWKFIWGAAKVFPMDFYLEVAKGNVEGHRGITISGQSEDIGAAYITLWERPSVYQFSTTANIKNIIGSNGADTGTVQVSGLDANWNEQTFIVTLNGVNAVDWTTQGHPVLLRVHSIRAISQSIVSDVTVYIDGGNPANDDDVRAEMWAEHQRSLMDVYSVPAGFTAYVAYGKSSVSENKSMHLHFDFGNGQAGLPFYTEHAIFLYQDNYDYFFKLPGRIPEKTDIKVQAQKSGGGAGNAFASAAFDLILVDNSLNV